MYPGPTIEANVDDRIVVNVTNLLPNATTVSSVREGAAYTKPALTRRFCSLQIHWHGLYQRGTPWYDGTNAITQVRLLGASATAAEMDPDWPV